MRRIFLAALVLAATACTSATAPSACLGGGGMSQGSDTHCHQ
jgi:hypothetical protein